jgi:hypothetical protein
VSDAAANTVIDPESEGVPFALVVASVPGELDLALLPQALNPSVTASTSTVPPTFALRDVRTARLP